MPQITPKQFRLTYMDAEGNLDSSHRQKGIHQSDIIRDLENTVIYPGKRRPYDQLTDKEKLWMGYRTEVGFIWETIIQREFIHRQRRRSTALGHLLSQEQIQTDGIWQSPDDYNMTKCKVHEYKATWRSSRRWSDKDPEEQFFHWFAAIAGYCVGHGTNMCDLFVYWLNGDYRGTGPNVMLYELVFSDEELLNWWGMITKHRDKMLARRKNAND